MNIVLMILAVIFIEATILFAWKYFETKEKQRLNEEPLIFFTPTYFVFFIAPLSFEIGWGLPTSFMQLLSATLIVSAISFFTCYLLFRWLRFFDDRIIISYPFKKEHYEVQFNQIVRVGHYFKSFGWKADDYYFIEFKIDNEIKSVRFFTWTEELMLRSYFRDRGIQIQEMK